ncbi:tyrosine-type recombinase/integrase [Leucothrix pacifica]|uniref:Integrase n=1 Tax=Leucothrix pacifica TaxID=1247513 RepID=A0A317CJS7_9GAMM|nr:integrase arm-type DNA-binding domain-containing protein [Leucothrix pacifica]PWQ97693.1 integrase [Leucothrix pacifica]
MQRKLSDRQIKAAKTKPDGKVSKLSDGGGLFLQVSTTGKYWRYNYRFDKKQKTLSLGVYPEIGLSLARDRHNEARELLARGVDPSQERQAEKQAEKAKHQDSFENIASEWFAKFSEGWTANHRAKVWKYLERDLFPVIGEKPISEIEPPEVLAACNIVVERGSIYLAHEVKQAAGRVFRYGVATGKCKRDAAADLRGALPPIREKHYPTITKPLEVGALLRALAEYQGDYTTKQAINLLPYLMCRPGELRHMEWTEIDIDLAVWIIPAGKMKSRREHKVPLSKQAISILESMVEHTRDAKYVFHGLRSKDRPLSENTFNAALRRLGFSRDQMVSHGFRGMASSLLNEQGWNPDAIEAQLAHQQGDKVRAAYNRAQYWDERVKMMQSYADYLDSLRSGADVIPIKRNQA